MIETRKAPCKDCGERAEGCHGRCERYKAFAAECEKARQARAAGYYMSRTALKAMRRTMMAKKAGGGRS